MTDKSLEDKVIAIAERHGWVIEDLNDNPNGHNWKAERGGAPPLYFFDRQVLALHLAVWILQYAKSEWRE